MRYLKGKVAVVTGAASGIGRAMAERFASEGMKVVLADVEEIPLAKTHDTIIGLGAEAIAVRTDVSRWEQVEELARRSFETFGAAHVVCNNAGVSVPGPAWTVSQTDWEWILGVNLRGVVHGVRAFVPRMLAQGEGHVVNTASIAGLISVPGMSTYCASKHAVIGFSECLHHDLALFGGGKVKVSVVCPAWVKTNIAEAERNRPEPSAEGQARIESPQEQALSNMVRAAVAAGIPPEVVADSVVNAIVEERFWVLTHPNTKRLIESRMSGLLADRDPVFDPT